MKKQFFLITILTALFFSVGCNNSGTTSITSSSFSSTSQTATNIVSSSIVSSSSQVTSVSPSISSTSTISSETTSVPVSKIDVVINNKSENDFVVSSDKSVAEVGEEISLTITSKSFGFEINSVLATLSDEVTPIDIVKVNDKYFYHLPTDGTISLTITKMGKDIKGYIQEDKYAFIDENPEMSIDGGITYQEVENKGSEYGVTYYTFKYGSKVRFSLRKVDNHVPLGLKVDDVTYPVDTDNKVVCDILVDDASYFFVNIYVLFKDEGAPVGEYSLQINNTEHLTASVYWGKDGIYPATTINEGVDAVIRISSTEPERYVARQVEYKYFYTTETTSGATGEASFVSDETGDYYTFKVPTCPAKLIIINIFESDESLLKDLKLAGTYLTFSTHVGSNQITSFDSRYVNVTNSGEISICNKNGEVSRSDIINSYDADKLNTVSYHSYNYGKDCILISTDGDIGIASSFGSYNTFCIKKANVTDNDEDYSLKAEQFKIDQKSYLVYEVIFKGNIYQLGFFEMTNKIAYFNSSFTYLYGSSILDNKVLYEIVKNNGLVKVVGFNGNGGYANRCFMEDYYGQYTDSYAVLYILGTLNAIYKDENMNYTMDNNVITLTSSSKEVVLSLNVNHTFTLISEKDISVKLPEFAGKKFRNNYAFEDDLVFLGFYIEFSDTDQTLSCVIASDYNLDLEHCSTQLRVKNINVSYTYDETTKTISSYMTVADNSTKLVTMTYVNGAIKISSKVIGAGKLYDVTATINEVK